MFFIFLVLYVGLFIYFYRDPVLRVLLVFQVLSLLCAVLLNKEPIGDSVASFLNFSFITFLNLLVILPWKGYSKKIFIIPSNLAKINRVTDFLCWISFFVAIILIITSILVLILVDDINQFKYVEGVSEEFYYNALPFNARYIILADYLYMLSYFLLPLHFFYLVVGDKKRAVKCLLFSLNIIFYGFTFFSRWTLLLYVSLFAAFWSMLNDSLSIELFKKEKKVILISMAVASVVFVTISVTRFDESYKMNYMSSASIVQNPTLYSFIDYLGMGNHQGVTLLNSYNGITLRGGYTFSITHNVLEWFGLSGKSTVNNEMEKLFGDYYGSFIGFPTYTVYDFGYILSVILCLLYFFYVRSRNKYLSIQTLLVSGLLLIIPLSTIFYSQANIVFFCLLVYFGIALYLKI